MESIMVSYICVQNSMVTWCAINRCFRQTRQSCFNQDSRLHNYICSHAMFRCPFLCTKPGQEMYYRWQFPSMFVRPIYASYIIAMYIAICRIGYSAWRWVPCRVAGDLVELSIDRIKILDSGDVLKEIQAHVRDQFCNQSYFINQAKIMHNKWYMQHKAK